MGETVTFDNLRNEKEECRKEFMSSKDFYKSMVAAIITMITLMTGVLAWGFNSAANEGVIKTELKSHDRRINQIENKLEKYHTDQMQILTHIKESIDAR